MRLQEMYYICKTCLANWADLESSTRAVQDHHFYRVSNAQKSERLYLLSIVSRYFSIIFAGCTNCTRN